MVVVLVDEIDVVSRIAGKSIDEVKREARLR
jgi:hypothetical protein